jgi:hypothetical protein
VYLSENRACYIFVLRAQLAFPPAICRGFEAESVVKSIAP